jgi:large repetitive protein
VFFTAQVTNTDTASTPTGSVQFKVDGNNYGTPVTVDSTGKAVSTTSRPPTGDHLVSAVYTSGSGKFITSTGAMTQTVTSSPTTTVMTSSRNSSDWGTSVRFSVKVSSPTSSATGPFPNGTVQITIDGVSSGAPLTLDQKGNALSGWVNPPAGEHLVQAVYIPANGNYTTSNASLTQTVKANTTSTTVTSNKNLSTVGAAVTFTAKVANITFSVLTPTGSVQFRVDGVNAGGAVTLSAGVASYTTNTLAAGTHTISAVYTSNNINYLASIGTMVKAQTVK